MTSLSPATVKRLAANAVALNGTAAQYDTILKAVGNAQVVMIGEESHGTHEFYHHRAEITKQLITKKGFSFVAVEADWPDAYRLNRYVKGKVGYSLESAFSEFKRFPSWMWRNDVVYNFIDWMRQYNDSLPEGKQKVGFYGLDMYSLFASAQAVINYLKTVDPEAAERARQRYSCFDRYSEDTQKYAMATSFGMSTGCQAQVIKQLKDMTQASQTGKITGDPEEAFAAEMNAKVVKDAEEYYRKMFTEDTWNIRDQHMSDTLDEIIKFYRAKQPQVKAVVWAHNSHLGDASATAMSRRGEINLGQLTRQRYGLPNTFNIGFSTYRGTVTAADEWDEPSNTMTVRDGLPGSYEELMHMIRGYTSEDFYLLLRSNGEQSGITENLGEKLQRAIGVIYKPRTERQSHYFKADLNKQFDAYIHIENSNALVPLPPHAEPPISV
jgi:erythromycin esterase-like protein